MLDGLLGRGFSAKCKSLIKLTKSRIEVIRRKRDATQKFLKKDIADLLANGLDINAYGRADGLLVEMTLSSCYDYVEYSSDIVYKKLSVIQKQRECPEECREAVSSLMFAAARFSDLPELRDLRQMFQERYENSLEYFVNKEFIEKLSSKPARMESKVQLMRDIALEFSIRWDSVAFQQRMSKPCAPAQQHNKNYGSFHLPVDNRAVTGKDAALKDDKHKFAAKERSELPPKYEQSLHDGKKGSVSKRNEFDLHSRRRATDNGYASLNGTKETIQKNDDNATSLRGKQAVIEKHGPWVQEEAMTPGKVKLGSSSRSKRHEYIDDRSKLPNGRENVAPKRIADAAPSKNSEFDPNHGRMQLRSDSRDKDVDKLRPYYNNAIPPPYVKPNNKPRDDRYRANLATPQAGSSSDGVRTNGHGHDHERYHHDPDDDAGDPLPKPKSVRRRHSRTRSNHEEDPGNHEDTAVPARRSRSKRKDDPRRGLQILFGEEREEKDEEERVMDRLLMHYSKKPTFEPPGKPTRKSKNSSRERAQEEPEMPPPVPLRSASLPHEASAPPVPTKVFARAASFQPDRSNPARHVHPKLPDYEDLAARFASLKGR